MRISDWSSDVCSSDLIVLHAGAFNWTYTLGVGLVDPWAVGATTVLYNGPRDVQVWPALLEKHRATLFAAVPTLYRQILKYCDLGARDLTAFRHGVTAGERSEEHTSELQSLMRISYAVFCLKKKNIS